MGREERAKGEFMVWLGGGWGQSGRTVLTLARVLAFIPRTILVSPQLGRTHTCVLTLVLSLCPP